MKKMIFAGMMAAVLAAGGGVSVNAQALTMEELKESLALKIDTNGLSGEELMEKGLQYENGESIVQWYDHGKSLLVHPSSFKVLLDIALPV